MSALPSLADRQAAFMAQVLDEDAPLPSGWGARQAAGIAVYRGNYRAALVEALRDTYEKTERWVGEEAFRAAAAHHLIMHPPSSWTLDAAGAGFAETCAELFANDPDVAELAWLEWAMLEVFTAADRMPLDPACFASATAGFGEAEWGDLRLELLPGASAREVAHDLPAIWRAMSPDTNQDPGKMSDTRLGLAHAVLVWREGERSTFALRDAEEGWAFVGVQSGLTFGELCVALAGAEPSVQQAESAAMRAGAMLGRWLHEGLIVAIRA